MPLLLLLVVSGPAGARLASAALGEGERTTALRVDPIVLWSGAAEPARFPGEAHGSPGPEPQDDRDSRHAFAHRPGLRARESAWSARTCARSRAPLRGTHLQPHANHVAGRPTIVTQAQQAP